MGKIYHNNEKSTWEDDTNSELYLMPGTVAFEQYKEDLQNNPSVRPEDEFHAKLEEHNADLQEKRTAKQDMHHKKGDVGRLKYRKQMVKRDMAKSVEQVMETKLGRDVKSREFEDEIDDATVTGENFYKEAVEDFDKELAAKESRDAKSENRKARPLPYMKSEIQSEAERQYSSPLEQKMSKYL